MNRGNDDGRWPEREAERVPAGNDPVNHPSHYCGKIEVIDFILDRGADYLLGNVLKYVSRAGKKSPDTEIQDLEKARWYLDKKIELLKEDEAKKQKQAAEALAWTE